MPQLVEAYNNRLAMPYYQAKGALCHLDYRLSAIELLEAQLYQRPKADNLRNVYVTKVNSDKGNHQYQSLTNMC